MQAIKAASELCTDWEQSFGIVFWGWLRSHMSDYDGQKGELFAIEEVGKLLHGKQYSNQAKSDFTDASTVPVSLKTQGSYARILFYPNPNIGEKSRFVSERLLVLLGPCFQCFCSKK